MLQVTITYIVYVLDWYVFGKEWELYFPWHSQTWHMFYLKQFKLKREKRGKSPIVTEKNWMGIN